MKLPVESTLRKYLELILKAVDSEFSYQIKKEGGQWRVDIQTLEEDIMLGENGKFLNAFQHLTRVLVHREHPEDFSHFVIDINGFRRNREKATMNIVPKLVKHKVLNLGETLIIAGLSSYERKQIHGILADVKEVNTASFGQASQRRLIISPTSETGSKQLDQAHIITIQQILDNYSNHSS